MQQLRRADGSGTKTTKITRLTKTNNFLFVILVFFVTFVLTPSARPSRATTYAPASVVNACFSESEYGGRRMPRSVMMPVM